MSQVVKLLRDLIALPSVNNAFLPPDDSHAGENRVAEYLTHRAAKAGFAVERQTTECGRDNLIARLTPLGQARHRIILAPHMDTVGGDLDKIFRPVKKGDRIHGRGACDTKGSVAVMFHSLERLAKRRQRPTNTEFVFDAQAGVLFHNANGSKKGFGSGGAIAEIGIDHDLSLVTVDFF